MSAFPIFNVETLEVEFRMESMEIVWKDVIQMFEVVFTNSFARLHLNIQH